MKRFFLVLLCCFLVCLCGCVQQPRPNVSVQSPDEILETMRLLMKLDGGTRLRDYEDILGGKLVLTRSMTDDGFLPFQIYSLVGPSDGIRTTMNIKAIARNVGLGKQVSIGFGNVDGKMCISKAYSGKYLSNNFDYGGPFPFVPNLFSYGREFHPGWPALNVGYSKASQDGCISGFSVFYGPMIQGWGH